MSETSTNVCESCTQANESWFLEILCRKYNIKMVNHNSGPFATGSNIKMVNHNSGPFATGPNIKHFESVKHNLQGSTTSELLHDYVSKWVNDVDYPKKQLLRNVMTLQNMRYSSEAYLLYLDWAPIILIENNPETEPDFMRNFCNEFRHLF
jgi:hypothetical protein